MKQPAQNVIGPVVRRLRRAARLSVEELAARMGRTGYILRPDHIAAIEAGRRRVLDRDVLQFARTFGVPIRDLYPRARKKT